LSVWKLLISPNSERGFQNSPSKLVYLSIFSGNCFQIVRVLTWGLESLECFFLRLFRVVIFSEEGNFFKN
jgi:hypothetical protein